MLTRRPVNGLQPRTLRELQRDPFDWLSGPHRSAEPTQAERMAGVLLAVAIGVLLALALVHWWSS